MPELYIITGSNGAGKSTIGKDLIPDYVLSDSPIFDGDKLFMQKHLELWKSGIRPDKQIRELANSFVVETFESLVHTALKQHSHFAYEGHFSEVDSWQTLRLFRGEGYKINLIFLGLTNTDQSELRVLERSIVCWFFDTSTITPVLLALKSKAKVFIAVASDNLPGWIVKYLPELFVDAK